ncbi:Transcriptional regulator [Candidatus Ornithobacterium hominis]|uniref:hypothetical protein n=1 Tax=Candidatus Ornithobacterium hominis TaxID=2497989 RepID=UPI0024BCCD94|nr:hypothetical protein [Candidatus Ornithobacterium hominis]CAI9430368.1 Transcriptional regulator [Candidatus Ornithobacterium hominis]
MKEIAQKTIVNQSVSKSIANYKRMGIDVDILEMDQDFILVKIKQGRLINGFVLNKKQLIGRAKEIFEPTGLRIKVIPVVYSLDVENITPNWIVEKMNEFGLKRSDITSHLAYDKSQLSLYLSGERGMTKSVRASFYWYFKVFELNRDFRE